VTAAEVRVPHARLIVAVAALVACSVILWLARTYTFYFDEWSLILTAPDWTWLTYLEPHNEHPSMLLRLIYAALLNTVGLRSYLPYMSVLLLLHATNVTLLFELVRRRAGDLVGMAVAALLLVLGAGWENVLWAFQLAWLASVALGLGTFLVLRTPSTPGGLAIAAGLITASLTFSGIGLLFAVAASVRLAATPASRKDLLWLLPVAAALAAWYIAFGRSGQAPNPPPTMSNVYFLPLYAIWGLGASVAGLVGVSGIAGLACLALATGAIAFSWRHRGPDPLALGVAAGLLAFYVLTGATRAQLGYEQAGAGRYVYVGAVFWLILLADLARRLPWYGTWRPALVACVFLGCFNSSVLLVEYAAAKTQLMAREVADLQALSAVRADPCLDPSGAVDRLVMPQVTDPALYYRAIDRYGDPSAGLPVTDRVDFDRARLNLVSGGCR
jgi:hypothetical protein